MLKKLGSQVFLRGSAGGNLKGRRVAEKKGVVTSGDGGKTCMCRASAGLGLEVETGGEEKLKRARCLGVFQLTRPTKRGG